MRKPPAKRRSAASQDAATPSVEASFSEVVSLIEHARQPGLSGFARRNLFPIHQSYETYRNDRKVSPLVTRLPCTHHLFILGQCKRSRCRTCARSPRKARGRKA